MERNERELAASQAVQLSVFLKADADAVRLCQNLFALTQVWDDLVDADKAVAPEDVNQAFWTALVELPQNPFYRRHAEQLQPVIRTALADWLDATVLETGTGHERTLAYVLRDTVGNVVSQCAYLLGGYQWMRAVSPDVRRMIHDETLDGYLRRLA